MLIDKYIEGFRQCCWINKKNRIVITGRGSIKPAATNDSFKLSTPVIRRWKTIIPAIILQKYKIERLHIEHFLHVKLIYHLADQRVLFGSFHIVSAWITKENRQGVWTMVLWNVTHCPRPAVWFFSSNWRIKIEIMRQKVPCSWYQNDDRRMVYAQFLPFSRAQSFTLLSMGGSTCSFPEQRLVIEPIYDPITLVINSSSSWSCKLATESVSKLTFRALALRHKPIRSDKGLTLETSALNLFTVANSHYQISC